MECNWTKVKNYEVRFRYKKVKDYWKLVFLSSENSIIKLDKCPAKLTMTVVISSNNILKLRLENQMEKQSGSDA